MACGQSNSALCCYCSCGLKIIYSLCRSDAVESILCLSLFPTEFSAKDKVKNWVRSFAGFDKVEVKALEKILEQKQRFYIDYCTCH